MPPRCKFALPLRVSLPWQTKHFNSSLAAILAIRHALNQKICHASELEISKEPLNYSCWNHLVYLWAPSAKVYVQVDSIWDQNCPFLAVSTDRQMFSHRKSRTIISEHQQEKKSTFAIDLVKLLSVCSKSVWNLWMKLLTSQSLLHLFHW